MKSSQILISIQQEMAMYERIKLVPREKNSFAWWQNNSTSLPMLSNLPTNICLLLHHPLKVNGSSVQVEISILLTEIGLLLILEKC